MKKVLIAFLILLLLGAAAIAYFFSTTDLNQIVPVIRDQLQRTLKISIQYQQASLGWKNGLGIEIQKLSIEPQGDHPKDDVLRADEIRVHLDLFSILTGHLQIGSVDVVKPVVTIVKTRQKKILVLGLGNFSSKNTDKPASASGALPLGFLIQDLKAAEAEILYRDESASPVRVISVHGLKVKIENFSLSQPFTVEISGSLYGNAKTFDVSTRLQIPLSGEQISFTRTKAAVDFDALNFEELKIALPFLQKIPLQEIHGNLDADFEKIILGSQGIQDLSGRMNIRDGSLSLTSLQKPVRDIQVSLEISPQTLKINQADFKIATSGAGQIHGSVNNWQKDPVISLEANLDQIPLGEILEYQPSQIHLEGILSVNFRGEITPQRDPQVPLINGDGVFRLNNGALINLNILQEVFRKLAIIPGLMNRLQEALPEESREKLERTDTFFAPIEQPFTLQQGNLRVDSLSLATDSLELNGSGRYQLGGELSSQAMLRISPDFSLVLIRSINEMSLLSDQDGRVSVPLQISGIPPGVNIFPDLNYVGSKIAAAKAQQIIGNLLQKKQPFASADPSLDPENQEDQGQRPASSNGLAGLLQNFTGQNPTASQLPQGEGEAVSDPSSQSVPTSSLAKIKGKQLFGELLSAALGGSEKQAS